MMGCISSTEDDEAKKRSKKIDIEIRQDKIAYRATHRLLLLGIYYFFCYGYTRVCLLYSWLYLVQGIWKFISCFVLLKVLEKVVKVR